MLHVRDPNDYHPNLKNFESSGENKSESEKRINNGKESNSNNSSSSKRQLRLRLCLHLICPGNINRPVTLAHHMLRL